MIKKIASLLVVLVMVSTVLLAFTSCGNKEEEPNYTPTHYATIEIRNYGTIELELYGNIAPLTVKNFVGLAKEGFYEGLTFHRIMSGFMIQGGGYDASDNEMDAPTIKGEFESNGVKNPIEHKRGVISMARTGVKDSASSQFFIMHDDAPHLDGEYAAFGKVIKGIEVVDEICDKVTQGYNGAVDVFERPVIEKVTIKEA